MLMTLIYELWRVFYFKILIQANFKTNFSEKVEGSDSDESNDRKLSEENPARF